MPWWGWLIIICVVFVVLVIAGVYVYAIRKVTKAQAEMAKEFDKPLGGNLHGPYFRGHFPER